MTNIKELPSLNPSNVDWSHFFNNDYPVDLEIGCGRPHFFFDRANNFSQRNIIGIEWKYEFVNQAQRRIVRENINNAAAFHGNAWLLTPLLFKDHSIEQVFVNFPDPWWKKKHKKRLVLNELFLNILANKMTKNGFIVLQTDVKELFDHYCEVINNHNSFKINTQINHEQIIEQTKAKTHREKKCQEQDLPIYRAVFSIDCD